MKFNIPRVPVDQTDNLTEYEFEYEILLGEAYYQWLDGARNNRPIEVEDGKFTSKFTMDEDEYQHLVELAESGEYVDIDIPADDPSAKKISDKYEQVDNDDQEPVDLNEVFGSKGL